MTVWKMESISALPEVTLEGWAVFEVPLHGPDEPWTRHFVGYSRQGRHGQVSSAVERFHPATCCGVTQSSRVYKLAGRPGSDADSDYVWARWKTIAGVIEQRDVSAEVYADIKLAADPAYVG